VLATINGEPAVAVDLPGQGRGVYLGPFYMYADGGEGGGSNPLSTGDADRLFEQAVLWAPISARQYAVAIGAGDTVTIFTQTPATVLRTRQCPRPRHRGIRPGRRFADRR